MEFQEKDDPQPQETSVERRGQGKKRARQGVRKDEEKSTSNAEWSYVDNIMVYVQYDESHVVPHKKKWPSRVQNADVSAFT